MNLLENLELNQNQEGLLFLKKKVEKNKSKDVANKFKDYFIYKVNI